MFTGIIQAIGKITNIESMGDDSRFVFNSGKMDLSDMGFGDSIAVNGVCLSVIDRAENSFIADLSTVRSCSTSSTVLRCSVDRGCENTVHPASSVRIRNKIE